MKFKLIKNAKTYSKLLITWKWWPGSPSCRLRAISSYFGLWERKRTTFKQICVLEKHYTGFNFIHVALLNQFAFQKRVHWQFSTTLYEKQKLGDYSYEYFVLAYLLLIPPSSSIYNTCIIFFFPDQICLNILQVLKGN